MLEARAVIEALEGLSCSSLVADGEAAAPNKISGHESDGRRVSGAGDACACEQSDAVGVGAGCAAGIVAGGWSGGRRPCPAGRVAGPANGPDESAVLHLQG
jgi:hypothetical protein